MSDIIELAKKCGAIETRIGWILNKEQLEAFEAVIRQDQIENNEKKFIHLLDKMILITINNFTYSSLAVQQLNTVKSQVDGATAYRKYFHERQTK